MHPDRVSIGSFEFRIHTDHGLNEIVAGRQIIQTLNRRTEITSVDHGSFSRRNLRNVAPKKRHASPANLKTRLHLLCLREDHEHSASDWFCVRGGGKGNLELQAWILSRRCTRCCQHPKYEDSNRKSLQVHSHPSGVTSPIRRNLNG